MRKYRILEIENLFLPQEKKLFWWVYLDNIVPSITWFFFFESDSHRSECWDLSEAKDVIRKRKLWLRIKYGIPIIHNYN